MSNKSGKVWGVTECVFQNPFCEFHRIEAKKGGVCSKHIHKFKTNLFYVESGKLLIRVWKTEYDLVDETTLNAGEYTEVRPNDPHQFEALEDTIAFEVYYPTPISHDIVRDNVGFIKK
jgi:quercetin dioxygenase-like cupin family protein